MKNLFQEMRTWSRKLIAVIVLVSIFAITMLAYSACIGVMLFYPYEPLKIDRIELNKTEAAQGEEVCFQFYGEKLMDVPASVSVELVNKQNYEVAKYNSYYPITNEFRQRCFIIPQHVRPHQYALRWTAVYAVNGIRNVTRSYTGNLLTVVSDKKAKP